MTEPKKYSRSELEDICDSLMYDCGMYSSRYETTPESALRHIFELFGLTIVSDGKITITADNESYPIVVSESGKISTNSFITEWDCEGECRDHNECSGKVREYNVVDPDDGFEWGSFYYCEVAAETDKERGMRLIEVHDND